MKKNSKLIMLIVLVVILVIGIIFNFKENKVEEKKSDAILFKEEYESFNNKKSTSGKIYPKVSLNENNPFVYASPKKVVDTLKNGTGLIYLGFPKCPWCRNSVNVLQYVNSNEILYLDMTKQRDTYEVINNKLEKTINGTKEYYEMLTILNDILEDYIIQDENDNNYNTGEKRIYVPLVIGVKNGEIVGYHADTVDLEEGQTPYDLLNKNQQEKLKEIYDEITSKVYDDMCDIENTHGC